MLRTHFQAITTVMNWGTDGFGPLRDTYDEAAQDLDAALESETAVCGDRGGVFKVRVREEARA